MRFKGISLALTLMVAVALLVSPKAFAQTVNASIHGTVKDTTGAVIQGATVVALNTSTGISTRQTTNNSGYYIFPQLQVGGPYTVTISKSGFRSSKTLGLVLHVGDQREINATLAASAAPTTIQVNANALQVETSNTELRDTVTAHQIENLPLLSRSPTYFQKLMPGTVESSDRFGGFSANGSQTQQNSYMLNGADINDVPLQNVGININPDALSEIAVVTSTLNPQYSRNSGAIVNETLKSGTNKFHGNAFEYYRDTFLNNGNYFSQTRPRFHENLYGATLGGPVLKNKLFFFLAYQGYRNATGATTQTPVPTNAQVGRGSNVAALSGDYNVSNGGLNSSVGLTDNPIPFQIDGPGGTLCGPGHTGRTKWDECFPSGAVNLPTTDFNSIASNLLSKYVPAPNTSGGYYNFNAPNTGAEDQGIIRIDYHLSQSDTLWADTVFQSSPSTEALSFVGATLPGWPEKDAEHFKIFNADWTHTFNANTLNDLRAGYFRFNYAAVEPTQVTQPSSYGFAINPQDPASASMPFINVGGYFTLGFSEFGPQPRIDTNESYTDNFTRIQGNHSLKFGAHVERMAVHNPFYAENNGAFYFSGSGQFSSGDPLLDFLVGIPSSYYQGSGAEIDARAWEVYAYAQDSWKVNDSLTLNYGTGYDIETPWANLQYGGKAIICFAPGAQSTVFSGAQPGLLYPGDKGCNDMGGATVKYDHLSPRFGFAWSPSRRYSFISGPAGDHRFSFRGGFGVYFNRNSEEGQLQNLEDPPYGITSSGAADVGGSPSFANPYQDVAGRTGYSENNKFPYSFPKPGQNINFADLAPYDLSSISKDFSVPYTMNFNLQIQRQLPGDQVLSVGYVGSLGRHLVRAYEANQITPAGHAAAAATCKAMSVGNCLGYAAYLPFENPSYYKAPGDTFLSVGQIHTDGSSSYNSLQVELRKAESHGLFYQISYTWSHALDNGSSFEGSGFGNSNDITGTNWVPGFQYLSYGNSEYDATNRFVAAYGYQFPLYGRLKHNLIAREALGGWNLTGITVLQSGFPVSIGEQGDNRSLYCNGVFNFYSCPDTPETSTYNIQMRNPHKLYNGQHYWFNPAPFSPEPIGTFGNVGRNFMRGPGFNYTNMAVFKNFPLGRPGSPRYIQIRMEASNVFNHPNFAPPDGELNDGAQFGTITSVIQPTNAGGDPQPARAVKLAGKIYF